MSISICKQSTKIFAAAGGVALVVAVLAASLLTGSWIPPQPADVRVIYVGADDCVPCRAWRQEHWPRFQASPEFVRLAYREVTSLKLLDLLKDDHWPEDLRNLRNELDRAEGVPLWFIMTNDKVVLKARGLRQWEEVALPRIRLLLR